MTLDSTGDAESEVEGEGEGEGRNRHQLLHLHLYLYHQADASPKVRRKDRIYPSLPSSPLHHRLLLSSLRRILLRFLLHLLIRLRCCYTRRCCDPHEPHRPILVSGRADLADHVAVAAVVEICVRCSLTPHWHPHWLYSFSHESRRRRLKRRNQHWH